MSMISNGNAHVDPNNVPLASLVAQEEHVDVNFIKNNNFTNNAYRNNFGNNNYRSYRWPGTCVLRPLQEPVLAIHLELSASPCLPTLCLTAAMATGG